MRSYKRSFNGFVAKLTDQERERLANTKGVVSVFPSTTYKLQRTRSWNFIGLNEKIKRNSSAKSDVVIGVIDSGIWPETESFKNEARDEVGHGTHTASTTAGNPVKGVSFYGMAQGTARRGIPSARIAEYKFCGSDECAMDGILAAFDDAIADGVDIITISVGRNIASDFDRDTIAIGSFMQCRKGY
ncbi:hypothetical protein PS1_028773 [Malus domestica]